jgi:hypothetical protein
MTTYQLGETPRLTATITKDGVAADPSTITISIRLPDRSMGVTNQAMSTSGTGSFYYDYTIPAASVGIEGTYKYSVKATGAGGRVTIQTGTFNVVEAV